MLTVRGTTRRVPVDDHQQTTVGRSYTSPFRHQNGLDAIDLEAMRQGNAERGLRSMTPARVHVQA